MQIGDKVNGKIIGIQPYGAFVELENGSTGLIHISEIRTGYIEQIQDYLKMNDEVFVQVIDVDEFSGKSSLSMRTLEEEKHHLPKRHRFSNSRHKYGFSPLAKSLPKWIAEGLDFLHQRKEWLEEQEESS